jgi:hypothetical protein
MATLGWLNIGMSIATKGVSSALKSVDKAMKDLSKSGVADLARAIKNIRGGLSSLGQGEEVYGGGWVSIKNGAKLATLSVAKLGASGTWKGLRLGGQLAGWAGKQLLAIGAAGLAAAGGLLAWAQGAGESMDATAKLADKVGSSTENIVGLQHAANLSGVSAETLAANLAKLGANLGLAVSGGGPAADALKALGLNAAELAKADRVDALGAIADRLNGIQNPAERAAMAMQVLGKSGQDMMPLLAGGSEGIRQATDEARELGLTFSRVDAAQVEAANDAMSRMGTVFTSIGQQLAIGLAPYVEAVATGFTNWRKGIDVGALVQRAIQGLLTSAAWLADQVQAIGSIFFSVQSTATGAIAGIARAIARLGEAIAWVLNKIPGIHVELGTTAAAIANDLDKLAASQSAQARKLWDQPSWGQSAKELMAGIGSSSLEAAENVARASNEIGKLGPELVEVAGDVGELETKLRDQIATFGLTGDEAEVYKLKLAGATEAQLAGARALASQLKGMEKAKDDREEMEKLAKTLKTASETPLDKFRNRMAELKKVADAGLIDTATLLDGGLDAYKDLLGKQGEGRNTAGAALELGSAEARTAILAFQNQGARDPMLDLANTGKTQLTETRKQTPILQQIARLLGVPNEPAALEFV